MSKNMDDFNEATAIILEKLYAEFPKQTHLITKNLVQEDDEDTNKNYSSTITFLAEEGFIRYSQQSYQSFAQVRLTSKGLAILKSVPSSLQETDTLVERIGTALSSGSKQAMNTLISQVITLGLSNV